MAERTRKPINLSPAVKARWEEYKSTLQREEGRRATDDELVGAFLQGVPLWQAELMVRAYLRHPLDIHPDDADPSPPSSSGE